MDPISNVDQLVLLLQQRLMERTKATAKSNAARKRIGDERKSSALADVRALAAVQSIDDGQLRRALVQNVLADTFGRQLVNDAKFQQVAEKVTATMENDPHAALLLSRIVDELRASAH